MHKISVIIPALNEAALIRATLAHLQLLRQHGHEVIVVDGSSVDETVAISRELADQVVITAPGRAQQLNAGAAESSGDVLLFLHADTLLPEDVESRLHAFSGHVLHWGRFDVRLSGPHILLRLVEFLMNLRSRISGIATGDQAIFVSRALFEKVGGFPQIALMEDISLSVKLKKQCSPFCLRARVVTSSRRWEQHGIVRTIIKMNLIRLRYALGVSADVLAREYD